MGVFDSIADAAKQHEAKIEEGIEKVGDLIDEKTGASSRTRSTRSRTSPTRASTSSPATTSS